jgi:hypothetical protein
MKTKLIVWPSMVAAVAGLFVVQPAHGAATESRIGEFAGSYSGTVTLVQSSASSGFGTTQGTFNASRKKENGTLTLASGITTGSSTIPVQEQYTFRGRSFTYVLSASGSSAAGFGTARIRKKIISNSATISSSGNTTVILGKIRRSSKRLVVTEQLSSPSFTAFFTYNLRRNGK